VEETLVPDGEKNEVADRLPDETDLEKVLDALKYDASGLVTVVAQDVVSGTVLMVAHADRAALRKTLASGLMHYYSRSRKTSWQKGETSGHVQRLERLLVDCDGDALLAKVRQTSGACHLGYRSCFALEIERDGTTLCVGEKLFDPGEVYEGGLEADTK